MFDSLLKSQFDTQRLTPISGTSKKQYEDNLTSQVGMLQPFGDEESLEDKKFGQRFKLFSQRIDLKLSDKVIISSEEYTVMSVKDFNYGAFPHMEAILLKQ